MGGSGGGGGDGGRLEGIKREHKIHSFSFLTELLFYQGIEDTSRK